MKSCINVARLERIVPWPCLPSQLTVASMQTKQFNNVSRADHSDHSAVRLPVLPPLLLLLLLHTEFQIRAPPWVPGRTDCEGRLITGIREARNHLLTGRAAGRAEPSGATSHLLRERM